MNPIDIIVPVFRGLEATQRCLESVIRWRQASRRHLVLVNDACPEPELAAYLRRFAATWNATLIEHTQNQGFVRSANDAMALHIDRDVVLLNSDTEVANDWLDRLRRCVERSDRIATATPFANHASLCSYPVPDVNNPLPEGWDVASLDALFRDVNAGQLVDLPTGVGCCMYIRRAALNGVGLFDEAFGHGYGEENDFCARAARSGWRHVLCGDVFIYHAGQVSFGTSASLRMLEAMRLLRRRHPRYEVEAHQYVQCDPARPLRLAVDLRRLARTSAPTILFVSHSHGGGTTHHVHELARKVAGRAQVLLLRPGTGGLTRLEPLIPGESWRLDFWLPTEYSQLVQVLQCVRVSRVHYHHDLGLDGAVWNLPRDLEVPYDITLHDFTPICPQVALADGQGRYCGEPDETGCNACLAQRPAPGGMDIDTWRSQWSHRLNAAARCLAPSHDTAGRVRRHFQELPIVVAPHDDAVLHAPSTPVMAPIGIGEPLRVVALGRMTRAKGAAIMAAAASDARDRELPLDFHVLGTLDGWLPVFPTQGLTVHGSYRQGELADRLNALRPHVIWFPSQTPETFSYTLSEALAAGYPIASTDLGALPERLAGRSAAWVLPWRTDAHAWNDFFVTLRTHWLRAAMSPPIRPGGAPAEEFDYAVDYVQSRINGAAGTTWITHELLARLCFRGQGSTGARTAIVRGLRRLRAVPLVGPLMEGLPLSWRHRVRLWARQEASQETPMESRAGDRIRAA